jgi:hypothetical protein
MLTENGPDLRNAGVDAGFELFPSVVPQAPPDFVARDHHARAFDQLDENSCRLGRQTDGHTGPRKSACGKIQLERPETYAPALFYSHRSSPSSRTRPALAATIQPRAGPTKARGDRRFDTTFLQRED